MMNPHGRLLQPYKSIEQNIMANNSLVSVIIIFLNAERFIEEAIESVFAQSYKNWELLLVDDGSYDSCTEIAQCCAAGNPGKVYYLEHTNHRNRGMSASRNLGIKHSKGEYIAFLDADDVWLPNKLEEQVTTLVSQPKAGMVYGKTLYWYSWTVKPEERLRDRIQEHFIQADSLISPPNLLTLYLQGKAAIPAPCSILVRRKIVEFVDGFEDEFRGLYEDQVFFAKICLETPVFVAKECWDRYRQHPSAACALAQNTAQEYFARVSYLKWLKNYLTEKRVMDPDLWYALEREFWLSNHPPLLYLSSRSRKFARWIKKWVLKIEEKFFPASFITQSWGQRQDSKN
jgi:glycosyltransferase involved in cell wall biosynthesis